MSNLYEISQNTQELKTCPVLVLKDGLGEAQDDTDYVACGCFLQPMVTRTILGDDYGEIPQYGVYFDCGHTFAQMEESLRWGEYI